MEIPLCEMYPTDDRVLEGLPSLVPTTLPNNLAPFVLDPRTPRVLWNSAENKDPLSFPISTFPFPYLDAESRHNHNSNLK